MVSVPGASTQPGFEILDPLGLASRAKGLRDAIFDTRPLSNEALRSVVGHLRAAGFDVATLGTIGQPVALEANAGDAAADDVFATLMGCVCQIRVSLAAKEPTP